jgi:hypothetical protein
MQYTATSFASMLIISFRGLLWPDRALVRPVGVFPEASHVETHVADLAEHDLFAPLFRYTAQLSAIIRTVSWTGLATPMPARSDFHAGIRPLKAIITGMVGALRRGAIQVHLLFIVLTLLTLFLIEGFSVKGATRPTIDQERGAPISVEIRP